ncbi:MAG: hypothetical protein NTX93_00355 [Bacteroidia bacterium]|nr:hypothetical protein [Bacteroidia bacterium]
MKKILFSILTLSFITISLNYSQLAPVKKIIRISFANVWELANTTW